ncbi:MAG: ankyrin repeat domain-containing protein [Pseudomonadota bacterium]
MCSELEKAVRNNDLEQVKELARQKNAINLKNETLEFTLLHSAVFEKNPEMVKLLLELGSDINATDFSGKTALHWAVDIFHTSCWVDCEIINLLLERDVQVNIKDKYGYTALDLAIENSRNFFNDSYDKLAARLILKATLLDNPVASKPQLVQKDKVLSPIWDEQVEKIKQFQKETGLGEVSLQRIKANKNSLVAKAFKPAFNGFFKSPSNDDNRVKTSINLAFNPNLSF